MTEATVDLSPVPGPAAAIGLATMSGSDVLDVWYPQPVLGEVPAEVAAIGSAIDTDEIRGVTVATVRTVIQDLQAPPVDVADAYLRLHLLSHRLVRPRTISLEGLIPLLPNVVWTTLGPVSITGLAAARLRARRRHIQLQVLGVDKFPRMVDYVVPSGVRIADADRVRLGAHLAEGTTVMHEGFCNFNAGTLGPSMVEGRISSGVLLGPGTDLGGGASVMGTLSGGGKHMVTLGRECLVGANAGVGISLGDGCVVEAGLYVTAGTKVALPDGTIAKARELSGQPGWLFRRNSQSGAVEAVRRTGTWGGLNEALHKN